MQPSRIFASVLALTMGALDLRADSPSDADDTLNPQNSITENIVVTAQRQEVPAESVGSTVTVITAEEIEARRAATVADLLRTVPGLEVARTGGSGQITSVFLRGGNSSHTLVLVDHVRVNATTGGAFDFADLSADQIERIEIVRGPLSTLYGSEAVAGVISITTRRGSPGTFHLNALAEAGELDHERYRLAVDGATERFDYSLSYSDLSTQSVSAAARADEEDPHENATFAGRLGCALGEDGRVDATLRTFTGDVAIDGFDFVLGPVDDLNRRQEREGLTGSLQAQKKLGRANYKLLLGFHDDELTGIDPDDVFSNFLNDSRSFEITAQTDIEVSKSDVLTVGYSYEEREGSSRGNYDEELDIAAAFLQNAWSYQDRFFLTVALRHDDHSEFGSETTYRLASAFVWSETTRFHASFGTGFKAPTLVDLFFPFFSNPDLVPETSRGLDLGVEQKFREGEFVFDLTYFKIDFEDLIVFDFVTFLPQNIGEAESSGFELSFAYRPDPRFQLRASYTMNETEDLATGLMLARRPENRGVLSLYLKPNERFRASATFLAVADRIDSDGSEMDDYERLDLTLQYRASEHFEPYLRLENLFDEDYEEVNGFGSPGSQAVVGLSIRY